MLWALSAAGFAASLLFPHRASASSLEVPAGPHFHSLRASADGLPGGGKRETKRAAPNTYCE